MPDIETTLARYLAGRNTPRTAERIAVERAADAVMERLEYYKLGQHVFRWSKGQGGFTVQDTRRRPKWAAETRRKPNRVHAPSPYSSFDEAAAERRHWSFGPEGGGL